MLLTSDACKRPLAFVEAMRGSCLIKPRELRVPRPKGPSILQESELSLLGAQYRTANPNCRLHEEGEVKL